MCSVTPGFDFADFKFLADYPEQRARLQTVAPEYTRLIQQTSGARYMERFFDLEAQGTDVKTEVLAHA